MWQFIYALRQLLKEDKISYDEYYNLIMSINEDITLSFTEYCELIKRAENVIPNIHRK